MKRLEGRIFRWWVKQKSKEFPAEDPVWKPWNVVAAILWWSLAGGVFFPASLNLSEEAREAGEVLPQSGLLLVALALVCAFLGVRRFTAAVLVEVTPTEVWEHDLWEAERVLLGGLLVVLLPTWIVVQVPGLNDSVDGDGLLSLLAGLLVIAPVAVFLGKSRWALFRLWGAKLEAEHGPGVTSTQKEMGGLEFSSPETTGAATASREPEWDWNGRAPSFPAGSDEALVRWLRGES